MHLMSTDLLWTASARSVSGDTGYGVLTPVHVTAAPRGFVLILTGKHNYKINAHPDVYHQWGSVWNGKQNTVATREPVAT